jgi:predicted DNA-binding transcriptional regulator YafY
MSATLDSIPDRSRPDSEEHRVTRPTARVLALLELLQGGGRHTVASLAHRLEVDERTVRRYGAHLVDLGIPVEASRGRFGGYRLAPGYKLPPLMFTDDEAVAVMVALATATASSPGVSLAIAKIRRVLPIALGSRIESLLSTMDTTVTARRRPMPATDTLLALADAARRHHTVTLSYTAWRGRSSVRDFDAYGLVLHSGQWYVTGLDHESRETRTFRLDRVRSVRGSSETFTPPDDFDPVHQVLAGLAAIPYRHAVSVILCADADSLRRRIPPWVGTLTEAQGGVRLRFRAERLAGAAELLASLGIPFNVEAPPELREEVRVLAQRLLAAANDGPTA